MKYRNIKTGQVIEVPSEVRGSNWELIGGKPVMETATVSTQDDQPVKKTRRSKKNQEG